MIHWIFMIRLSWSCTWSWTPCPRPPPWTSTSSSPPWPLPPPLPGLEHLHSSTLAHNRWLFFWISITRSSSEFLPLCGQDDSLLSWTHTHSPFSILGHPRPLPPPLPPTHLNDSLGENQVLVGWKGYGEVNFGVDFLWGWLPMNLGSKTPRRLPRSTSLSKTPRCFWNL